MEHHVGVFNSPYGRKDPLIFCDVTLREGEQTPGVTFTLEEKKQIVRLLDEVGVGQVQIAHPRFVERSLEVCREICAMPRRLKTEIMTNGMWEKTFEAIDRADECGPDIIHSYFFASLYQYPAWSAETKRKMLERIDAVVGYIKGKGRLCNVSLLDAPRTDDPQYLMAQVDAAGKAGADRIRVPDTVGVCDPEGYYTMVSRVKEVAIKYGMLVGIHTHNDFGLALANTLAGLRAGADLVDCSINGLGDRAGNVSLAELVVLLEGFYDFPTGIDVRRMKEVSDFGEQVSGLKTPANKPLVGAHVFSDESELHNLCMDVNRYAYQGILPEEFGASRKMIFGKLTTGKVLELAAQRAGKTIDPAEYPAILQALYEFADTHKGVVPDETILWKIVRKERTDGLLRGEGI